MIARSQLSREQEYIFNKVGIILSGQNTLEPNVTTTIALAFLSLTRGICLQFKAAVSDCTRSGATDESLLKWLIGECASYASAEISLDDNFLQPGTLT